MAPKFIELAGEVNVADARVRGREARSWRSTSAASRCKGAKVLVLGLAYKKDIDDPRESPAFEIIELLLELGAEVAYHDPHIPVAPRMRQLAGPAADGLGRRSTADDAARRRRRRHRHRPHARSTTTSCPSTRR